VKALHHTAFVFVAVKVFDNKVRDVETDSFGDYKDMVNFLAKYGATDSP